MTNNPLIILATHDGGFHADDVLAASILSTIYDHHRIIRTRDKELLNTADIVFDVGGVYDHHTRRYDHHMKDPPCDKHDHVLSSAGLIWRHYSKSYLRKIKIPKSFKIKDHEIELYDLVDKVINTRWIYQIDRNDNGISNGPSAISELVASMLPIYGEKTKQRYDDLYLETVSMVSLLFKRSCFHAVDYVISKSEYSISNKEKIANDRILVAETEVKNFGNFSNSSIHFVIYPAEDLVNGGIYYTIKPIYEVSSRLYKTTFNKDHLGLDREDLAALGVDGISFVHHNGFMAKADSKEQAIKYCLSLLENQDDH